MRPAEAVDNIDGWLTTVVAQTCLDLLRSRRSRQEDAVGVRLLDPIVSGGHPPVPEDEIGLADSVGSALRVVLDQLDRDIPRCRRHRRTGTTILVNGAAGAIVSVHGRTTAVMGFVVMHGRIVEIDILADPSRILVVP
ncbi:hypothetical protein F3087_40595 [Nocardia colli]|uniref:Uncharacterized protein n=1 Tax=Nocardia colli TaxID=2545717 RepID=A0A5N0DX30_9NOCA|nr:hypothetical protein [Nocardia colli]KAA8880619.1 hypothetical protein F3087_40595 [Nocardia colli]